MKDLKKLHGLLKNKISDLESQLAEADMKLAELHSLIRLEDSPFRNVIFRYKTTPVISHTLLDKVKGSPVSFKDLCAALVKYIIRSRSPVDNAGNIKCDSTLMKLFKCDGGDAHLSFFQIMKKIGRVID